MMIMAEKLGGSSHRCRKQYFETLDLLINELKRRFQQKRGLTVAAMIQKVLLNTCNGLPDSGDRPEEIQQLYQSDLDLPRLKVQLQMLPDLIRTRNIKLPNSVPIKEVINVRTLYDLINKVSMSKEMLSEVVRLIRFFKQYLLRPPQIARF